MGNECCTPNKTAPIMILDQTACEPDIVGCCGPPGEPMVVFEQGERMCRTQACARLGARCSGIHVNCMA